MAFRSDRTDGTDMAKKPTFSSRSKKTNYDVVYDANAQQYRVSFYTNKFKDLVWNESDKFWTIENGYEYRTDLISKLFYGTAEFDWVIEAANNINDPIKQITAGTRIIIPGSHRLIR